MEKSRVAFAVSLFIVGMLSVGVSGLALNEGNQEVIKADTLLAGHTREPCVYRGRYLTVDLRKIAAQFK